MRYLGVLIFGLLLSCNVFENENSLVPDEYIGEWEWIGNYGGWGPIISADSVEHQIVMSISKLAEAKWYRNDRLIYVYEISIGKESWTEGELVMYRSNHSDEYDCGFIMYMGENETLMLSSADCTDQPTVHFQKKKTK